MGVSNLRALLMGRRWNFLADRNGFLKWKTEPKLGL